MSEEKKCYKKWLVGGVIASLVFSIVSFGLSLFTILGINGNIPSISLGADLPISKKYDRGRNFKKALKKNKPVVLWFYTDWCGYCQKFAPTFDEVTKDKAVKKNFAIAFVNCDNQDNKALMEEYNVHGFPTVFVVDVKSGKKVQLDNFKFFQSSAKDDLVRDLKEFLRPEQ